MEIPELYRKLLLLLLMFGPGISVPGQTPDLPQEYFQQQVDYLLDVRLDDTAHELTGTANITYTNASPDTLRIIWFHLWANAFGNKRSAFARQALQQGDTEFYFSDPQEQGGYLEVEFHQDGKTLDWSYDSIEPDIALVRLSRPLLPDSKTHLEVPFRLRIPDSWSRLGHVGESYQMTQWYPKPAVYDNQGWHPMPYLDQGEFYSEFGNYELLLTLPRNYVVAATGLLETDSEKAFLDSLETDTRSRLDKGAHGSNRFPPSDTQLKTIRFSAEQVHDFAWFADKRFLVLQSQVQVGKDRPVETWAFFTPYQADKWAKATDYLDRSVAFYSQEVGAYPWPQATAVQSSLSAGAGMEYPMITVIGSAPTAQSLDRVITHEVGHNWFYGILASNERLHPWMDEGINTFYENRYMETYYGSSDELVLPEVLTGGSGLSINELALLYQARRRKDQAPDRPAAEFSPINYGLDVYLKTGRAFGLLEQYLGKDTLDSIMREYYQAWKFRHPGPEALIHLFRKRTSRELDWFFDGILGSTRKTDYHIKKAKATNRGYQVWITNREKNPAPFPLAGIRADSVVSLRWEKGFTGTRKFLIQEAGIEEIRIDPDYVTFDLYRQDNQIRTQGLLRKTEPLQLRLIGGVEHPGRTRINISPAGGWNAYDGLMTGLAFYSFPVPARRLEYVMAPTYGWKAGELSGLGRLSFRRFFEQGPFESLAFRLSARSYHFDYSPTYGYFDRFSKISPGLSLEFARSGSLDNRSHRLDLRYIHLFQEYGRGIDRSEGLYAIEKREYWVNVLAYHFRHAHALHPLQIDLTAQNGKGFLKVFGHLWQTVRYPQKGKALVIHAFAGWMDQDEPPARVAYQISGINGGGIFHRDYLYDEVLPGRNETSGLFAQQIFRRDANLKTLANIGSSDSWMAGLGMRSGVPLPLPLEPYMDLAVVPGRSGNGLDFHYSGGVALVVLPKILEVYFPLLESDDIRNSLVYQERKKFFERVTFLLDLKKMDPWKIVNELRLW